jgi:hypothetical protein
MDLHLHTPASSDYKQTNVSYLDFLKKADERNLDIIAFTDHNSVVGYARYLEEVESLELLERLGRLREDERQRLEEHRRLREKILILPGLEFTATLGFHILGIFPPETTVRELEHLLLMLRVPTEKLDQGSGEVGATSDVLTAYRMINEAGGLVIAAHANSSHGVAMPGFDFGGQTRIAYTQDSNLHALEVTDLDSKSRRRTATFFNGTKPEYPRRMHSLQGSDAHKLDFDPRYKNEMGVGDRATEILIDEVSFEAIREVLLGNDFARTRPSRLPTEEPFDPIRAARELGDTLVQSFHERLHERRGIAPTIIEDVVALANTNGGIIYVGASSNPRAAVNGVDRPEQASAELRASVSKEVTPPIDIQVDVLKSQNKNVLQVIVPRGTEVPYAVGGNHIYVRSENETTLAHRDEIVQLVRDVLAVEFAASMPGATPSEKPAKQEEETPSQASPETAPAVPALEPPRTGVEIVESQVRKGVTYYAVRDLRNGRIVQNVTRSSARRLWQYAIEEKEHGVCDPDKIAWAGKVGICKSSKRGGKTRYDLVQRVDGKLLVYYGVTEDGIHGPWRGLVEAEMGVEPEESEAEAQPELPAPDKAMEQVRAATTAESEMPAMEPPASTAGNEPPLPEPTPEEIQAQESLLPMVIPDSSAEASEPATEEIARGNEQAIPEEISGAREADAVEADAPAAGAEPPVAEEKRRTEEPVSAPPSVGAALMSRAPEPTPVKTRAQEWREILDRAIADARAAQQGAKERPETQAPVPQISDEENHLTDDRATVQAQSHVAQAFQSEEEANEVERNKEDQSGGGQNPDNGSTGTRTEENRQ